MTVSPGWLLRAVVITLVGAALCAYLTVCILFVHGQWQMVLHPARPGASLPLMLGGAAPETVHFNVDASGRPQLGGVWVGASGARSLTILYLPSGNGSLADAAPRLAALQELGLDVFGFDYRGYGQSAGKHPSQSSLEEDSEAALRYLEEQRRISDERIVLYGEGVGGFLAARLAVRHPSVPGVILEHPRWRIMQDVAADPRVRALPVRLLFSQRFDLASVLAGLSTPKLLLIMQGERSGEATRVADPKITVFLAPTDAEHWTVAMRRFLGEYASYSR